MANLAMETWLRFVIWLVIGLAIYFFYGRKHSRLAVPVRRAPETAPSKSATTTGENRRERASDVERLPRLRTDRTGPESGVERHAPAHPQAGTEPARIGLILR